jgi:Rrf2 family transcriptional regulator, iron-sulfur cluster assembly transcription factor
MLFASPTEYAIRAMTFLASLQPGQLAGAKEISEHEKIPMPFLWKILQILAKRRLVRSFKGKRGGYQLAVSAEKIAVSAIVEATEGAGFRDNCVLGLPHCDNRHPCALHEQWKGIRADLTSTLDKTSLADLARAVHLRRTGKGKRLS